MMKKNTTIWISVAILMILLSVMFVMSQAIHSIFSGTVKINGKNATINSTVIACLGDIQSGETQIYAGYDGNVWYTIQVFNGTTGENVTFRIDGLLANEFGTYVVGVDVQPLNLTVNQSSYTLNLVEGWNLISIPLELKYDGCVT